VRVSIWADRMSTVLVSISAELDAGKLPPTPAHREKIRQYLWRAGWDGKSERTQELKDKAYQISRPDKESF
jgi:hypothetical protein